MAPETPAVTGRVLMAESVPQPIPGVIVMLGSAFTLTDVAGNFVLLAPHPGPNMLLVDRRTASTPGAQYPPVEVNLNVSATGPTRVPFIVYLPKLDTAHVVTLPLNGAGGRAWPRLVNNAITGTGTQAGSTGGRFGVAREASTTPDPDDIQLFNNLSLLLRQGRRGRPDGERGHRHRQ